MFYVACLAKKEGGDQCLHWRIIATKSTEVEAREFFRDIEDGTCEAAAIIDDEKKIYELKWIRPHLDTLNMSNGQTLS